MHEEEDEEEVALQPSLTEHMAEAKGRQARGAHRPYEPRPDNFTGSYRGVRSIHSGSQYVRPEQTLGDDTHCWCGELLNHDWPGKKSGRKHPKEGSMAVSQVLNRNNLKAYSRPIQDFILMAVEKDELKYTVKNNSVMLFPPDGTAGVSVYARNNDRQLQTLETWYRKHVVAHRDEVSVEKLAERLNDPVEHPKRQAVDAVDAARRQVEPPATIAAQADIPLPEVVEEEWVPFVNSDGKSLGDWEMTTSEPRQYRCLLCIAEGKEHIRDNARGMGGHKRTAHQNSIAEMTSPEAKEKAVSSRRVRTEAIKAILEHAIVLNDSFGFVVPTADSGKVERLEAENRALKAKVGELQAKLDLMREALSA